MAAEAERTTELDRIIFFSDGVFAIAITLLVIGLRVPALPSHVANSELSRRLLDEWARVLSYALSFAVIGLYWIGHHRFFGHIRRFDHRLILFNLAFLGFIAFLPFPTAVLGRYGGHRSAVVLYAGSLALAGLASTALWLYAWQAKLADVGPWRARYLAARAAIPVVVFAVSIPIAFVSPAAAQLSWFSFLVVRRIVEIRYGVSGADEGAFA
jgi:TMEM175 potassium channel family protein